MILTNTTSDSAIITVDIEGGTVPTNQIGNVELTFSENKHDIATVTYGGFPGMAVVAYKGLPVRITVGNNEANLIEFTGYVAYVEVESLTRMGTVNDSLIQMAKVVCFGSSYQMKPLRSTTYANKTIKQLTEVIAAKYNFSYSVPNNNYVFPLISQQAISDWELLVNTAKQIGYAVTANTTHLSVYDPFSYYIKSSPVTVIRTLESDEGVEKAPGNIYEFNGFFGDITPQGDTVDWTLKSLDIKGKEIKVSSTQNTPSGLGTKLPTRFTHELGVNTTSKAALEQYVKQYSRNSYGMTAVVKVVGISTAMPGRLVLIDSYNSEFDGYWLIEEATHHLNEKHYITTLKLKTDSINRTPLTVTKESPFKTPPPPKLSNNLWKATTEEAYVY